MSGLFKGGLGKLAAPLGKDLDPVGHATSNALFGKEKQRAAMAAPAKPSSPLVEDEDEAMRQASLRGRSSTVLTGARGVSGMGVTTKTLLGS